MRNRLVAWVAVVGVTCVVVSNGMPVMGSPNTGTSSLAVAPGAGPRGTGVLVSGGGFESCDRHVYLSFQDAAGGVTSWGTVHAAGFRVRRDVPAGAAMGLGAVIARPAVWHVIKGHRICGPWGIRASVPFTVADPAGGSSLSRGTGVSGRSSPRQALSRTATGSQLGSVPIQISFEPNVGQADAGIRFIARTKGSFVSLTRSGALLRVGGRGFGGSVATGVGLTFIGARPPPRIEGVGRLPGVSNYYLGSDPARWRTDVPHFSAVLYRDVYPGVDVRFHGNAWGEVEYDFVVAPGADPSSIRMGIEGPEDLAVDAGGDLIGDLGHARFVQPAPRIYQIAGGRRKDVKGAFVVSGSSVSFAVGGFDHTEPLVIDPVIAYSTYIGGTGGDWDLQQTIAVDRQGAVYRCGGTDSGDFPVTPGAYQPRLAGSDDAVVFKLNPEGTALEYATYLGGAGFDGAWGCTIDRQGDLFMVGRSHSSDFPTTVGAFQRTFAGGDESICTEGFGGPPGPCDGVVAKFDGQGRLIYSSYIGGSGDDETSAVRVDAHGDAYVAGITTSTDLPLPGGGYQQQNAGIADMYIAEVNPIGSGLIAATYFGGTDFDGGDPALGLGPHGDVFAASSTSSMDLPTTGGAFQPAEAGGLDAFAVRLDRSLSTVRYSTYVGGTSDDAPESNLIVDRKGDVLLDGATGSADFPLVPGAYQPALGGGFDAWVAEFDPTGESLLRSTYLGGSGDDFGSGAAVDRRGRLYEMTFSTSTDFPTKRAFQSANAGGLDMTVTQLSPGGGRLLFSSYLGGSADEFGSTLALDPEGNLYADGCSESADFPVTKGAFQTGFMGGGEAFGYCGPSDLFVTKIAFGDDAGLNAEVIRGTVGQSVDANQSRLAFGRWPWWMALRFHAR